MNETILNYIGDVTVKLHIGDKIVELEKHNTGLPLLRKTLCKFLTGNYEGPHELPQFLDLQYNANPSLPEDAKIWVTYLSSRISLTGKVYEKNSKFDNWISRFTAIINHTDLLNDISESDPGEFRLVILNGYNSNSPENSYKPLAQLPVDAYMLARITPGTQAMIEWVMQIRNA